MTFKTSSEIENYIKSKMLSSIKMMQERIYQIINRFVKEYYSEWSPDMYDRTYQLYRSLVKSEIKPTKNGYEAYVYFDIDALDYAMKHLNGKTVSNTGYSEEKTLEAAAHGSHGGFKSGTAIWDEPIKLLTKNGYNMLKQMLVSNGIPVK